MYLLDQLSKSRALNDGESTLLERIIRRQETRARRSGNVERRVHRWTAEENRLLRRANTPAKRKVFAAQRDIGVRCVELQFYRITKREICAGDGVGVVLVGVGV